MRPVEESLLTALCYDVRFFSDAQVTRRWFAGNATEAQASLKRLAARGLVEPETRLLHPELAVSGPVVSWEPEDPVPDFLPVAYRLRTRWSQQPRSTLLWFPTRAACGKFGGSRVKPRPREASHDLLHAAVYLHLHQHHLIPEGLSWRSGDTLRSDGASRLYGKSVPDAVLTDRRQVVQKIIECGGAYQRKKLEAMHVQYAHVPYEIW